jgi:hypothetical protein
MPLGKWLTTTPGRFRLASVVLVGALLIGLVATATATNQRSEAARTVGFQAIPELTATVRLYGFLADADATASIIFLQAGLEDPALHQRYLDDLQNASEQLAIVARQVGSSPGARKAVGTIAAGLPLYAGDVDSARANIRQGFPVGASYLRAASDRMRGQGDFAEEGGILPAATALYERAARMLNENYETGTSGTELVLVLAIGILLIALLVGVQVLVTQRSNRILNVALVTATVVVLALVAWTVVRFVSAQDSLQSAQRNGSDSVQLLSAAKILALQAQADENHALGERGTGAAYVNDFTSVMERLGGSDGQGGVLGEARTVAERTGSEAEVDAIAEQFQDLASVHADVRTLDDRSNYNDAVTLATGRETEVVHALDASLQSEITRATQNLNDDAADARSGFGVLSVAIPVLLVLAGMLVLLGLQRRISEYR